jgi:hypothetical protein
VGGNSCTNNKAFSEDAKLVPQREEGSNLKEAARGGEGGGLGRGAEVGG